MAKEEVFQTQGKVVQALANTQFRVKLDTGHELVAHIAGSQDMFCAQALARWTVLQGS